METNKSITSSTAISLAVSAAILIFLPFYFAFRQTYDRNLEAVQSAELAYLSDVAVLGKQSTAAHFAGLFEEANYAAELLSTESLSELDFEQALIATEKLSAEDTLVYDDKGRLLYGATAYGSLFRDTALAAESSGEGLISEPVNSAGTQLLGVAAPFSTQDGRGSLVLLYKQAALSSLLDGIELDGGGQLSVISPDGGVILLHGDRASAQLSYGEGETQQRAIETDRRLTLFDTRDGARYTAYATPLGINDWLVLYTIPERKAETDLRLGVVSLSAIGILTVVAITVVFAILAYKTVRSKRQSALLAMKFRLATRQSSRAAFEYDRRTDRLSFISESEHVKLPKPHISLMELGAFVHPADRPVYYQAVADLRGKGTTSVTVRVVNFGSGEVYRWYQVSATRLTDKGAGRAITIGSVEDIDERENERRILHAKATTDGLTGLMNRAETEKQVNEKLSRLDEDGKSVFALFDLDSFKEINDQFGHDCGDRALVFFADMLRATFRFGDVLGRLGGDEFVVHMTLTADKEVVARRLMELTDRLKSGIDFPDCEVKGLSCSVGCCIAQRGDSFESVYKRADEALYKAKIGGKKQFVIED